MVLCAWFLVGIELGVLGKSGLQRRSRLVKVDKGWMCSVVGTDGGATGSFD